jgi:hypothetical protein
VVEYTVTDAPLEVRTHSINCWRSCWEENNLVTREPTKLWLYGVDQDVVRSEMREIDGECWELRFSAESGWRASGTFGRECCGSCLPLSGWWSRWFRLLSWRKGIYWLHLEWLLPFHFSEIYVRIVKAIAIFYFTEICWACSWRGNTCCFIMDVFRSNNRNMHVTFSALYAVDCVPVWRYRCMQGVDLLAGVEAIISHLIVKEFKIPAAHAPAVLPPPLSTSLSPRSAAEEVSISLTELLVRNWIKYLPVIFLVMNNSGRALVSN